MDLQTNMTDIPGWPLNGNLAGRCVIQSVAPGPSYRNDVVWDVLRLDLLHPVISGNKSFKLQLYLSKALAGGKKGILTFGGPHSNHIHAAAFAAQAAGLSSIGFIRGEEPRNWSHTLRDAREQGMQLVFLPRDAYRRMTAEPAEKLQGSYPDLLVVPEGGHGTEGMLGAAGIHALIPPERYDLITCACGTGTMMAGLVHGSAPGQRILGVSALKGYGRMADDIRALLPEESRDKPFEIEHGYHFGGYAKTTGELLGSMNRFHAANGIPTEFVYTGKLMYAIDDLIRSGHFPPGTRILAIHSGGLQGNRSLGAGILAF